MVDKTYELITLLYEEFKGFRGETREKFEQIDSRFEQIDSRFEQIDSRFEQIDSRFERLEDKIGQIDNRLLKVELQLENEIKPNIIACLDGYQAVYEKLKEHDVMLENINNKLEKHDVEITVIKGYKDCKGDYHKKTAL